MRHPRPALPPWGSPLTALTIPLRPWRPPGTSTTPAGTSPPPPGTSTRPGKPGRETRTGTSARRARHLDGALASAHDLAAHLRASYPAEGSDLDALTETIGLARSVSDQAKTATTAHLTQTICNHLGHTIEHVKAMGDDPDPEVREFNADHARTHLDGAIEHVGKLTRHLRSNYPAEAGHLADLKGPGRSARRWRNVSGQAGGSAGPKGYARPELAGTITAQLDLSAASRAKAHATASATPACTPGSTNGGTRTAGGPPTAT